LHQLTALEMRKLLIVLLLCCPLLPVTGISQGWSFEYAVGYGNYQLNDIKRLQSSNVGRFGLKETDRFPGYATHALGIGFVKGGHLLGGNFSYLTTGGRLHRADYSGSYTIDMIINGRRLGAFYRYYNNTDLAPLKLYLQMGSGAVFSELTISEQVNVYAQSVQETIQLKGVGMYIEPSIGAAFRIHQLLQLSLGGGYQFDFLNTMKLKGQETSVEAHWNGFRFHAGLIIVLPYTIPGHE
jgi:hypothetical protein